MIISRYLTREVMQTLLTVTFILMLAFLCQQVVRYLNFVASGKIPTSVLLQLVSFEVPYLLAILLPLGLYLGILLAYNRLYADNEMAIFHLCGFSHHRVLYQTGVIAIIIALAVFFLMMVVNPWISEKRQKMMASDETAVHLVQTLMPGRFQVSPDGHHVMFVEKLSRDRNRAQNVFLAQEKKNQPSADSQLQNPWMLVSASEGYQVQDKATKEQYFVTTDGYRYEGIPGQNDYKIIQFKKYWVRILQNDVRITHQEVETLSTLQLWHDYQQPKRAAELQWRFSVTLSTFLLALLAVPLSTVRPRQQGRYLMLLPAILIYIVYINLLIIARHWVEQGSLPITLGIWWVHGLMLLLIFFVVILSQYVNKKR